MRGVLFVISGPSGVGKGTLVKLLLKEDPSLTLSISCTTRQPRQDEENGREYFFLTKEEFESRLQEDGFLEYDEHFGNYYGTPKSFVWKQLESKSVILEIDVVGALNVKSKVEKMKDPPRLVLIFIAPPGFGELTRRLAGRESESEEQMQRRLDRVRYELMQKDKYDYVVTNDVLQDAKRTLQNIIGEEIGKEKRKYD